MWSVNRMPWAKFGCKSARLCKGKIKNNYGARDGNSSAMDPLDCLTCGEIVYLIWLGTRRMIRQWLLLTLIGHGFCLCSETEFRVDAFARMFEHPFPKDLGLVFDKSWVYMEFYEKFNNRSPTGNSESYSTNVTFIRGRLSVPYGNLKTSKACKRMGSKTNRLRSFFNPTSCTTMS